MSCRVLLDHCSDKSFVTERFAKWSNAQIKTKDNYYRGVSQEICKATRAATLQTSLGGTEISLSAALTPEIATLRAVDCIPHREWTFIKDRNALLLDKYPRPSCDVDVMLGLDVTPFIIRNTIRKGTLSAEITHDNTIFLRGVIPRTDNTSCPAHSFLTLQPERHEDILENLFSLENVGIESPQDTGMTSQEEQALEKFNAQTTYNEKDKTYSCGILWKDDRPAFEGSRAAAISRLLQQERKFAKDESYGNFYRKSMQGYFERNDIYHIPDSELGDDKDCYYLPHSAVWKKGHEHLEPRIVFDGSAKDAKGNDPNTHILSCPNNTLLLVVILLLFRFGEVGLSSDISKMYMSLQLRQEDQRYARFVWRSRSDKKISTYAFQKTPWGLADSSFKCIQVLRRHAALYEKEHPEIMKVIHNNFYVDDLLAAFKREKATPQMISKLVEIVSETGYKLRKFVCSHPELIAHLPSETKLHGDKNIVDLAAGTAEIKALGVQWNYSEDVFLFPHANTLISKAKEIIMITKRVVSSFAGQIFDPLGLVLPITIAGKILLQKSWQEEGHWDTGVSTDLTREFRLWIDQLDKLYMFTCPRYVNTKGKDPISTELIAFGDAAPQAASALVYVHTTYEDGEHQVQLAFAKSKVAPHTKTKENCPKTGKPIRKPLSLPRLELLAATLTVRVADFIANLIDGPTKRTFLSDSTIALYWIHKPDPTQLKTWPKNRVKEILEGSSIGDWFHVPGNVNPADSATRKEACQSLTKQDVDHWFHGPTNWDKWADFLKGNRQPFLSQFSMEQIQKDRSKEICEEEVTNLSMVTVSEKQRWWSPLQPMLSRLLERCSTFEKLLRVTCLLIRVACPERDGRSNKKDPIIRLPELRCAKRLWFQYAQLDHCDEWKSWPHTYFDEETKLWRLKGRLDKTPLPFDYRHQVCLPAKHRLTKLFIVYMHVVHNHSSPERTLTNLRHTAWLMPSAGLRRIQDILKKEPCCRRPNAKAATAEMGDLPAERLTAETVFQFVGIDTAGPLPVWSRPPPRRSPKDVDLGDYLSRKKRKTIKEQLDDGSVQCVHFLLVTCMSSRMICIEPLKDLTADTMYQTLAKVFNRRGWPAKITSDNHKTFTQLADLDAIASRIEWNFIPDRSPHWGGFYERLIGILKQTLRKLLRASTVTYDEFGYLLSEAERSVNDRPLAKNLADPHEDARITPSMLVLGRPLKPEPSESDAPPEPTQLTSNQQIQIRIKQHRSLRQQFWRRWRQQYMLSLQEYGRVFDTKSPSCLKPGDVVLIMDPATKRQYWKLGRLISVQEGRKKPHDKTSQIRSALIKTSTGEIRRSAHLLAPMEVEANPHSE